MTLAAGTKLGPYEILTPSAPVGWVKSTRRRTRARARRRVKVLPATLSSSAMLRQRPTARRRRSGLRIPHLRLRRRQNDTDYLVMGVSRGRPSPIGSARARSMTRHCASRSRSRSLTRAPRGIIHRDLARQRHADEVGRRCSTSAWRSSSSRTRARCRRPPACRPRPAEPAVTTRGTILGTFQ